MYPLTQLPHRSSAGTSTVVIVALLSLASAVAAYADPPAVSPAVTQSAKVSLADLDLTRPAGARIAYERIKRVAERLCDDREDAWSRYHAASYDACVRETVADAVRQIHAPALVALED
jgi:UrcA family protein